MNLRLRKKQKSDDPCLETLGKLHQLYEQAAWELSYQLGRAVCVEGCGKCCEVNCIQGRGPEGRYAAQWLRQQPQEYRDMVLDRAEAWLVESGEKLGMYRGPGTAGFGPDEVDQLVCEMSRLIINSPCPFLDSDSKRCLIHAARPLACMAWGVTRVFGANVCKVPIGRYETEEARAYLRNETTEKIREEIDTLKAQMEESGYIKDGVFLATLLMLEMRPQKFYELLYNGRIPSAKLVLTSGGSILWQEQLDEHTDREATFGLIVNPVG